MLNLYYWSSLCSDYLCSELLLILLCWIRAVDRGDELSTSFPVASYVRSLPFSNLGCPNLVYMSNTSDNGDGNQALFTNIHLTEFC